MTGNLAVQDCDCTRFGKSFVRVFSMGACTLCGAGRLLAASDSPQSGTHDQLAVISRRRSKPSSLTGPNGRAKVWHWRKARHRANQWARIRPITTAPTGPISDWLTHEFLDAFVRSRQVRVLLGTDSLDLAAVDAILANPVMQAAGADVELNIDPADRFAGPHERSSLQTELGRIRSWHDVKPSRKYPKFTASEVTNPWGTSRCQPNSGQSARFTPLHGTQSPSREL